MRRAARHLFTLLSALSLLLCVATCVLWVRSYWVVDRTTRGDEAHGVGVISDHGETSVFVIGLSGELTLWPRNSAWRWDAEPSSRDATQPSEAHRFAGFAYADLEDKEWKSFRTVFISVPDWFLLVLFALLPMLSWKRLIRRGAGHCPTCGYDLRASPERCPECGTPTAGLPTAGAPTAGAANPRAV